MTLAQTAFLLHGIHDVGHSVGLRTALLPAHPGVLLPNVRIYTLLN